MKKTFLAKRNALLSASGLTVGTVMFLFVLVVAGVRFLAPDLFLNLFAPLMRTGNTLGANVGQIVSGFSDAQTLAAANELLSSENAALALQNRILAEQVADLSMLRGTEAGPLGVVAGVLSRPPESPYDTLIVSQGAKSGITLGMEAFGAGGAPLGIATAVSNSFTRITLFSAPGQETFGWVGKNRTPLTLLGRGAGAFSATVSKAAGVIVGDGVYVPGPGALLVGTVIALEHDPASPAVTLSIRPALNPFSIPWVTLADTGVEFRSGLTASSTQP